jgi:septal ring factor EnvC (AmiA/AmiB activator)
MTNNLDETSRESLETAIDLLERECTRLQADIQKFKDQVSNLKKLLPESSSFLSKSKQITYAHLLDW